ncbi:MAG: DUF4249 family protein [Balneola sp.]
MRQLLLTILIFTLFVVSCDQYPQDDYEQFYVVETYLVAQNELPEIYLSTTAPVTSKYLFQDYAVSNASVTIDLLSDDKDSSIEQFYSYSMDQQNPGVYKPRVLHEVLPSRTYRIRIEDLPNDPSASIVGYTTVPDTFSTLSEVPDTVVYQSGEQIELKITESVNPDRQSYFIFTTISESPEFESFTPLYLDFYDEDEEDLGDYVKTSSGIVNEENFDIHPNGTLTLKYPWIGVAFFGDNLIVANTVDDNVYDFLRSQSVQLGGSTLSPGEIPNVLYKLEGGIGIFGSLAADTIRTYIKRPSE